MTGCEVERDERTARRYPAITRGGSPLMPSHSQGAERRPERRAGRTGSRWLPRARVVGELLEAADQPPESVPKNHRRHAVTSILTAPERPATTASPRTSGGTADVGVLPVPVETVAARVPGADQAGA